MSGKCLKCNKVYSDEKLVSCTCGGVVIDEKDLPAITTEQEDRIIRKIWFKLLKSIFGGFCVFTIIAIISLLITMIKAYKTAVNRLEATMITNVQAQFEEPRIRNIVEDVAAERASLLMAEQIQPQVTKFKNDVADQLRIIDSVKADSLKHEELIKSILASVNTDRTNSEKLLANVTMQLTNAAAIATNLQEIADLQLLVIRAQGDDAFAWDILTARSRDKSYRFRDEAKALYAAIQSPLIGPEFGPWTAILLQPDIDYANNLTLPNLTNFASQITRYPHAQFVRITWERTNTTKYVKMSILAYIIEHSQSLNARAFAGKYFTREKGDWFGTLDKEPLLEWWKNNQDRIKKESEEGGDN